MLFTAYRFNDSQISAVTFVGGETWFRAADITHILGYVNSADALAGLVSPRHQETLSHVLNAHHMGSLFARKHEHLTSQYVDQQGVAQLFAGSAEPCKQEFADFLQKKFGVEIVREEQKFFSCIMKLFEHKHMIRQFAIGNYRIDLYFPVEKVAVECGEQADEQRDQFIKHQLGCTFVKLNPDEPGFDFFSAGNTIMRALHQ